MYSQLISRQVAAVTLFLSMVFALSEKIVAIENIILAAHALFLASVFVSRPGTALLAHAPTSILLILILIGLSPILKTLTRDISDDSIWVLSLILFLVHLIFHDYRRRQPNSISLNAAVFASVMLASRLDSNYEVSAIVIIGMEMLVLVPAIQRSQVVGAISWIESLLYISTATRFLSLMSFGIAAWFMTAVFVITFVLPGWFTASMRFKNEISGPWDEATIDPTVNKLY